MTRPLNWQRGVTSQILYAPDGRVFARVMHVFDPLHQIWTFTTYVQGAEGAEFASIEDAETFVEASYLLSFGG